MKALLQISQSELTHAKDGSGLAINTGPYATTPIAKRNHRRHLQLFMIGKKALSEFDHGALVHVQRSSRDADQTIAGPKTAISHLLEQTHVKLVEMTSHLSRGSLNGVSARRRTQFS